MMTCFLVLALVQGVPRGAPGTALDEGVLVVRIDTAEVARESFRLSQGRLSRGGEGWVLATTIRYDRARPVIVLSPILEVNTDTLPATLQYDVADPRQPARVLGELGRGRFTVRFVARATERAREFPTGQRAVVLDDSVFATYLFAAWLARTEPASLTAIYPRSLRRETVQVQDLGLESPPGSDVKLRHYTVTGGPEAVHVWLDTDGRLMRVHIPSRRLTAERLAGS